MGVRRRDYRGWPLRQRLELLAFDARLAGVPPALLAALWLAIDEIGRPAQKKASLLVNTTAWVQKSLALPWASSRGPIGSPSPIYSLGRGPRSDSPTKR
jgi:hypothetical protein